MATSGSLPPPSTSASAARVHLLHRRTNSYGCPRSLDRLMASCGTILQQQERAQQIVAMLDGRPVFLIPARAPAARNAEPTQDAASAVPRAVPAPRECAGVLNSAQAPLAPNSEEDATAASCTTSTRPTQVEPMDATGLPNAKRPRDTSDSSDDERTANDGADDAREAAIARTHKRRAGETVATSATSRVHVTPAAQAQPALLQPATAAAEVAEAAASPRELSGAPSTGAPSRATAPPTRNFSVVVAPAPAAPPSSPLVATAPRTAQDGGAHDASGQAGGAAPVNVAAGDGLSGAPTPPALAAEGQWTLQQSKAGRRKARKLTAQRPTTQPAAGTCLFRPVDRTASFLTISREAIARHLAATPGVSQVRVNTRLNVVAADAETNECLAALLATQSVAGIAVRAGRPASRGTSRGLVFGVDPHLTTEEILANLDCEAAVSSAVRKPDGAVLLEFAAPSPPPFLAVFKLLLPVRGCRPRPTQCARCGRLDHVTACCRASERCARCGGGHTAQQCTASALRCTNCGGPHAVTNPRCPRWQHERKVATAMARAPQPVPRAEVVAAVRTGQPLSYADMARRCTSQQQQPTASQGRQQQQQRKPARRPPVQRPPAAQPRVKQPQPSPAALGPDQMVPILLALVHSLVGRLPAEDPDRMAATAALAQLNPSTAPQHG